MKALAFAETEMPLHAVADAEVANRLRLFVDRLVKAASIGALRSSTWPVAISTINLSELIGIAGALHAGRSFRHRDASGEERC
jgi:hypothetical protein